MTSKAAQERLHKHGPNALPQLSGRSRLALLLEQFQSSPVLLLAGAAALSIATGGLLDAVVILGVVALNAGIGFATESNTERIIGSLRLPTQRTALVRRDGKATVVPIGEFVPGDVLALKPGVIVPADARIVSAEGLSVDESMLTGESLSVAKTNAPVAIECALAERTSMVYRGTTVVGGSGLAVVVATGARTEAGRVQLLVGEAHPPDTPMQRQLDTLGRRLVGVSAAVCGAVFVIGLLRGNAFLHMVKEAIALAVAAVPEGLPTLATTALALGVEQMRRREVLVRRLDAIETLAAVNVIGFDKTGTLTQNLMSAAAIACGGEQFRVADGRLSREDMPAGALDSQPDLARLLETAVLCSEARLASGDGPTQIAGTPTEAALVRLALDAGIDARAARRSFPLQTMAYRSDERQYMATVHATAQGGRLYAVKGNPEQVLALCGWQRRRGKRVRINEAARQAINGDNRRMAEDGLRVLGLAFAEAPPPADGGDRDIAGPAPVPRLTWLGLAGLADPARQGIDNLLARFDRAGVRVLMLTGDQATTATAIARSLNLANGAALTTAEADQFRDADDGVIADLAQRTRVFARVTPADKLRIVEALQAAGNVVAMTGDGINDSPALRAADVGIVMGRSGTDAAREVADIVLQGDDLAAIGTALKHGRTTYGNIRKAIRFLLATNLSEILVMLVAMLLGKQAPLTPIQLLWINLLSDVLPALGLALEPEEAGILEQPPRDPHEPMVQGRDMRLLAREGSIIAAGSLAAYGYGVLRHGASARASTVSFTSLVGAQLLHALTCRSDRHGVFDAGRLPANPPLTGAVLGSAGLQVAILTVPVLRRFMGLARLDALDAVVSLAGAALPYLFNEAAKLQWPEADTAVGSDEGADQRRG